MIGQEKIRRNLHRYQPRLHVTYIPPRGKCGDLADLWACAGDPELDAPLPATLTRDLYPAMWRGHLLSFAHAQVILNSMHRYQPRLHVIYIPPRGEDTYWGLRMRRWSWTRCTATSHACTWSRHVWRTLIELCACAGDPELDASLPATPARDLYPATWRGDQLRGELQDFYLHWDEVHRRHRIPEP